MIKILVSNLIYSIFKLLNVEKNRIHFKASYNVDTICSDLVQV